MDVKLEGGKLQLGLSRDEAALVWFAMLEYKGLLEKDYEHPKEPPAEAMEHPLVKLVYELVDPNFKNDTLTEIGMFMFNMTETDELRDWLDVV